MTSTNIPSTEYATPTAESAKRDTPELRIGVIGTGLMAKSHTVSFLSASSFFDGLPLRPKLAVICDESENLAREAAKTHGFENWTTDWQSLVDDPSIDLVDIVTPNFLHKEMALAAMAAGKHIYCEKPLAVTASDAKEMYEAAEKARVVTLVGFNYLRNPAVVFAKELIEAGELGEIRSFSGNFVLDAVADPGVPFTWRFDRELAGAGALGDVGAHVISLARTLIGDIKSVCGLSRIFVTERSEAGGTLGYVSSAIEDAPKKQVENDDLMYFLCEFEGGSAGVFESSRVATGRRWDLSFSISGSKGSLQFAQQRNYELQLFVTHDPEGKQGFRAINMEPGHGEYGRFWPFGGVPLGLHELKVVEVHDLIKAIAEDRGVQPDFQEGYEVCRVIDAVLKSAEERRWVKVKNF